MCQLHIKMYSHLFISINQIYSGASGLYEISGRHNWKLAYATFHLIGKYCKCKRNFNTTFRALTAWVPTKKLQCRSREIHNHMIYMLPHICRWCFDGSHSLAGIPVRLVNCSHCTTSKNLIFCWTYNNKK